MYHENNFENKQHVVSVLFNEPKLLKSQSTPMPHHRRAAVSVLFNEPKLLKYNPSGGVVVPPTRFSALQRAEIAEI